MNKNDLERMLSLADDRYVEELFSEKISMSKRRPYALFAGCAAALIAVAAGINLLVGDPGGSDDITDLNRIQTETTFTESALPLSGIDGENENSEYRMYFKKAPENTIDVQNYDTGGLRYEFTGDYVREVVPFETDRYHDTLAGIFCDNEGNPVNTVIQFRNDYIVFQLNDGMNITINENGELFPQYSLEEYTPVKRFGVDVYGFEMPADKYGNSLYLYFVSGGRGYSISFYNGASYDEAGAVMDAIILNGLSSSDFDLSKGIKKGTVHEKISLDEANKLEDFEGFIPNIETFRADEGNYVLASSTFYSKSTNDISEGQQVTLKYQLEQDENTYILMNYDTIFDVDPQGFMSIKIDDLDMESIEKFSSTISNKNNETYPYYSFTIIFDDFHIFVSAQNCSADTLWNILSQIPNT